MTTKSKTPRIPEIFIYGFQRKSKIMFTKIMKNHEKKNAKNVKIAKINKIAEAPKTTKPTKTAF